MRVSRWGHREVSVELSVLTGVRIQQQGNFREIYELFVGTNETVRNIQVSILSGCP